MIQTVSRFDSPWRRIFWTLPLAFLIWAVALLGLSYFMEKTTPQPEALPPVDARFIEKPVPTPKQKIRVVQPAPRHESKPVPISKPQPAPAVAGKQETKPDILTAAPGTSSLGALSVPGGARSEFPAGNHGAQTGYDEASGKSGRNIYANSGARAIVRPMPQIPDELRDEAFNFAALARFHVSADGSATVELARPTPDPRLNRILLESLKKWRFMPAIKNGKPAASTEEIVIKIEVK